ncbi:TspO/MBR family protein [Mangrovitalea sediminis]|uniref:TspO/MBR family protein n=1 Tax=Mangrovitalea sediminis TaxID=1982043 RepID=UPI0018E9FEB8|nr:TspO/MBR family protein [Mangrovitalea sediminis]
MMNDMSRNGMRSRRALALFPFLLILMLVASSGAAFHPGAWYAALIKPAWTPPNAVFPVAWTLLYLLIAISGWRAWLRCSGPIRRRAFTVYGLQLLLNLAWSWLFFGRHWVLMGLIDMLLLLVMIMLNIVRFRAIDIWAARLLWPYMLWVLYAVTLNAGILWLN